MRSNSGVPSPDAPLDPDADEAAAGAELVRRLEAARGAHCVSCESPICFHQVLAGLAFGAGERPRCVVCLARQLEQAPTELAEQLLRYFERRACFRAAWDWATRQEGVEAEGIPDCFWRGVNLEK